MKQSRQEGGYNHQEHAGNQDPQTAVSSVAVQGIFVIVILTNLMINIDHGIMPAAASTLRLDLNTSDTELGLLGSYVFLGLVLGSLVAMPAFNYLNTKFILVTATILNCGFLILFTLNVPYWVLCLSRTFSGFCQVFFCIYFPVWVDIFGPAEKKTIWMTFLMLGVPLGVIIGYIMTASMITYFNWRYSFYIQISALVPLCMSFVSIPNRFLEFSNLSSRERKQKSRQNTMNHLISDYSDFSSLQANLYGAAIPLNMISDPYDSRFSAKFGDTLDAAPYTQRKPIPIDSINNPGGDLNEPLLSNKMRQPSFHNQKSQLHQQHYLEHAIMMLPLTTKIKMVLNNFAFLCLLLTMTGVFFTTTALQYWMTDYFINVMGKSKQAAFLTYSLLAATSPIIGVLVGGQVIQRAGGYNNPIAFKIIIFVFFFVTIVAYVLPTTSNFYVLCAVICCTFFCGGFGLPILTGIMLNTVPAPLRTLANSYANLIENLLGYFPAPILYGMAIQHNGGKSSRAGMWVVFWCILITTLFMFIGYFAKKSRDQKIAQAQDGQQVDKELERYGSVLGFASKEEMLPLKAIAQMSINDLDLTSRSFGNPYAANINSSRVSQGSKRSNDRIQLDSISGIYSSGFYPQSLRMIDEDESD